MAYNEFLADRIRQSLGTRNISVEEKGMFGGLTFMVNDKMCVGVVKDDIMARIDPEIYEESLKLPGCRKMEFTGRPMQGFVFVDPDGTDSDEGLESWIEKALAFNDKAKSSRKKTIP